MECVVFHAAELFGQIARFSRTEPCRFPTPTSPAPAWSAMPTSSRPTAARSLPRPRVRRRKRPGPAGQPWSSPRSAVRRASSSFGDARPRPSSPPAGDPSHLAAARCIELQGPPAERGRGGLDTAVLQELRLPDDRTQPPCRRRPRRASSTPSRPRPASGSAGTGSTVELLVAVSVNEAMSLPARSWSATSSSPGVGSV